MSESERDILITEVGPRDGLQNEPVRISTADKISFVNQLSKAGVSDIEVSAFVRTDVIPQLSDAEDVFAGIKRHSEITYSALVPNVRGLERAMESGVGKIALFTAASETFADRNTNSTIDGTLNRFKPVCQTAHAAGIPVRVYVSCAVACPYEGPVAPEAVRSMISRVKALGDVEIDLADTIGAASVVDIEKLLCEIAAEVPLDECVLHLHDTGGQAVACARQAIEMGVRRFDAACGGLGGCPFAPGAPGNLSTEALVSLCESMGMQSGIDVKSMQHIGQWIRSTVVSHQGQR